MDVLLAGLIAIVVGRVLMNNGGSEIEAFIGAMVSANVFLTILYRRKR